MDPINLSATIDYDATYYYSNPAEIIGAGTLFPVKYSTASGQPIWSSCPGSGLLFIDGSFGVHNLASKSFVWNNLASFSDFTGANTSQPLPIELLYFNAEKENKLVTCRWVTQSETNNDYFTVERSKDAVNFETIGQITGAGTSTLQHSYSYTDAFPIEGISYYRLRQTDFDGTSTTSEIDAVEFLKGDELLVKHCTFDDSKQLIILFNRNIVLNKVEIHDLSGRCIALLEPASSGIFFKLQLPPISSGIYTVVLSSSEQILTAKCFSN
jgi:hypothetical protein